MSTFETILDDGRCLIFVGPGGVGKTSTAAALGLAAAERGYRTCVLTIDPARRLANALGLPEIGNRETMIGEEAFVQAEMVRPPGTLTAMMLDIKEAWDEVIRRYHPDPERAQKLADNRLYQVLSTALAGSQEYMAMEKLYQLAQRSTDRLDRIVLDTPPAHHAVDFLDAPHRIIDALSNDATRWLLEPLAAGRRTGVGRFWEVGAGLFVRTISKITGGPLLEQLAEMLQGFQSMFEGFQERASSVRALLASDDTRFVIVSRPTYDGLRDVRDFVERLRERSAHVGAVVLNRAHTRVDLAPATYAALQNAVTAAGGTEVLTRSLWDQADREAHLAAREERSARELEAELSVPVILVPELPSDVRDLRGLAQIRDHLVPGTAERSEGARLS